MDYLAAMRSFVRAVDLGSLSRAAQESGAKVSTVSRHICALEADVGAALLNRSTHRLHLTEIGAVFHAHALRIVADVDAMRGLAASLNDAPQGLLRISLPAAFGRRHVMPHLAAFLDAHPAIRIDATLTDIHVDLIEAGADVAIRIGTLPDSGLVARRLAPHRRIACASPGCVARGGPVAQPADLARHDALVFSLQPTASWHFRHATGERRSVDVSGRLRANDSEALLTCALAGQGVALLPTWLAHADLARGALLSLLPDWEGSIAQDFEKAIWAVYPPKKIVSPKVRAFIDFFEARFRRPAYWDAAP